MLGFSAVGQEPPISFPGFWKFSQMHMQFTPIPSSGDELVPLFSRLSFYLSFPFPYSRCNATKITQETSLWAPIQKYQQSGIVLCIAAYLDAVT